MKHLILLLSLIFFFSFTYISCRKETAEFTSESVKEYIALEPGKYIRYKLDSTRYVNFGQDDTTIYYEAKDVVDAPITDNQGRSGWRVIRYLRDTMSTREEDWKSSGTYIVIPTDTAIEVIENNFRYLKLMRPINENFNWQGNAYLPEGPFRSYGVTVDNGIQLWDYTYGNIGETVNINNKEYQNTLTVTHLEDSADLPYLSYKIVSFEKYAKGIGLIYKETVIWDYQQPNNGNQGYKSGFGIRMSIIDHN